VASALDAAHRAGLVHRDVKPGNILVDAREDRPDHVYLSDFGVAKAVSSAGLTGPGFFVGTASYAAPEQIQGRAVDGRADQYALACVAFQLLAGALPFPPEQDLPALLAHVSAPRPSLTARRPDLPAAVDPVMARAMARNPEERYASCLNFADALREALGLPSFDPEGPVTASAAPEPAAPARDTIEVTPALEHPLRAAAAFPRRDAAWIRRNRLRALGLAGAALAAAGAIAIAVANPAKPPGPAPSPTTSPSPDITLSYTSVPIKLPPRYAGPGISSLAFSPGGTTLAIANDHPVCLWDISAGTGCRTGSAGMTAGAVAFSPDGKTVAIGGIAGRVVLLRASTMVRTAEFADPGSYGVVSLAFSPDGKTVAAGDDNGSTYLWDAATGKAVTVTNPGSKGVVTVAFSPDGKTLAVGDLNSSSYLWDVARGKLAATLTDPGSRGVDSMAFSPDGAMVATGDFNKRVYLWDVATRTVTRVYPDVSSQGVNAVAFSPDGRLLAAGDGNGAIFLWSAARVHLVKTLLKNDSENITALAFTPDSKTLAAGDENGDLTLWQLR
jgi:WD40 repeat protein